MSDTFDNIEQICAMNIYKFTQFCWTNKIFRPSIIEGIKKRIETERYNVINKKSIFKSEQIKEAIQQLQMAIK